VSVCEPLNVFGNIFLPVYHEKCVLLSGTLVRKSAMWPGEKLPLGPSLRSCRARWDTFQPPGALTDDGWGPITRHPLIGTGMLEEESDLLRVAEAGSF
jgi:hypothetical protein